MNKLTYIEARDKIWNAYFRDEIQPNSAEFCFCGTICDGNTYWFDEPRKKHRPFAGYKGKDFVKMEVALFSGFDRMHGLYNHISFYANYEERLFFGMLAALEVLKNIHRERGDFIPEDEPLLTKRVLTSKI